MWNQALRIKVAICHCRPAASHLWVLLLVEESKEIFGRKKIGILQL